MKALQALRALGPIDLRSVRRDSTLPWMISIPLLSSLAIRWGMPPLVERIQARYAFDLTAYLPVLLAYFFVTMTPVIFGVLIGFLLLDEKDDRTLTALQVTPLSLTMYLVYRIAVPVALTVVMICIIFPLSGYSNLSWGAILLTGVAAAPLAPLFALYLAAIAQNKVQGFALMKLSGAVLLVPVFAYFVPQSWELLFGIIPTYWPMKVYWLLEAGQPGWWPYLLVAVVYQSALAALFVRRFNTVMVR